MSTIPPILDAFPSASSVESLSDPAEAMQVLEEQHIVALTDDAAARRRFAAALRMRLDLNHRAAVVHVSEELLFGEDDREAALEAVPTALVEAGGDAKHQYFLWNEMDSLSEHHAGVLRRVLHRVFAAAAEREFVSPERLVIQRHVLLGGPRLAAFATGSDGAHPPLTEWLMDDSAAADLAPTPRVVVVPLGD